MIKCFFFKKDFFLPYSSSKTVVVNRTRCETLQRRWRPPSSSLMAVTWPGQTCSLLNTLNIRHKHYSYRHFGCTFFSAKEMIGEFGLKYNLCSWKQLSKRDMSRKNWLKKAIFSSPPASRSNETVIETSSTVTVCVSTVDLLEKQLNKTLYPLKSKLTTTPPGSRCGR